MRLRTIVSLRRMRRSNQHQLVTSRIHLGEVVHFHHIQVLTLCSSSSAFASGLRCLSFIHFYGMWYSSNCCSLFITIMLLCLRLSHSGSSRLILLHCYQNSPSSDPLPFVSFLRAPILTSLYVCDIFPVNLPLDNHQILSYSTTVIYPSNELYAVSSSRRRRIRSLRSMRAIEKLR